jgi:hypothetical protein
MRIEVKIDHIVFVAQIAHTQTLPANTISLNRMTLILATKARDAIDVAPSLVRLVAPGGTLLPIQNGGVPQILASQIGDGCLLGGLSNLTATMLSSPFKKGVYLTERN